MNMMTTPYFAALNNKKSLSFLFAFALFFFWHLTSHAAFSVETTRIIHHENDKSSQFTVSNTGNKNYLIQTWIETTDNKQTNDFAAVPPLFKLNANTKNTIQVIRNSQQPADRESLYWANIKFVEPSVVKQDNVLRYSITNRIKLIYRPEVLRNVDLTEQVSKLKFTVSGKKLLIENPTPVYVNLNGISVGDDVQKNPGYFAPFSKTTIDLSKHYAADNAVKINYINDFGASISTTFKQ
jgi:fimbrial chaperone protein